MLRLQYGVDPDTLSDAQWAKLVAEAQYLEAQKRKDFRADLEHVLAKLMTQFFSK